MSFPPRFSCVSCSFPVIVVEQSAKLLNTPNGVRWRKFLGWYLLTERYIAQALVRAMFIIEGGVRLNDVIEMSQTETGKVVQAFAFERSDP